MSHVFGLVSFPLILRNFVLWFFKTFSMPLEFLLFLLFATLRSDIFIIFQMSWESCSYLDIIFIFFFIKMFQPQPGLQFQICCSLLGSLYSYSLHETLIWLTCILHFQNFRFLLSFIYFPHIFILFHFIFWIDHLFLSFSCGFFCVFTWNSCRSLFF